MEEAELSSKLGRASLIEGLRFTSQVAIPNVLQGLFRRRRTLTGAANRLGADKRAVSLISGIVRSNGPGPIWVRVVKDEALLISDEADIRRVLGDSPRPFAPDPEAKRKGMAHFQPDALTISRGELWRNRREFAESVLDTGQPFHRLAGRHAAICREEAQRLLDTVKAEHNGELSWDPLSFAVRRITRRIVLGEAAADDEELSDLLAKLMDEANSMPSEPSESYPLFAARLSSYAEAAEEGSLTSLFAGAPHDEQTKVAGQFTHWLFALGDTLAVNLLRAVAVLAVHPRERAIALNEIENLGRAGNGEATAEAVAGAAYLDACLNEAMRLWPTTAMLSRETEGKISWNGEVIEEGTQLLISNTFNHRDPDRHDFADRFAPEEWTEGSAGHDWTFNHFSHGPQGCPGATLALFVGKAMLAELLPAHEWRLESPGMDLTRPLPHTLDHFAIKLA